MIMFFKRRIVVTGHLTHNTSWQDIEKVNRISQATRYLHCCVFDLENGSVCFWPFGVKMKSRMYLMFWP